MSPTSQFYWKKSALDFVDLQELILVNANVTKKYDGFAFKAMKAYFESALDIKSI